MKIIKNTKKEMMAFFLCLALLCSVFSAGIAAYGEEGYISETTVEGDTGDITSEIPAEGNPEDNAEHYGLWISGRELTSEYYTDGMSWEYNKSFNTLTLNNSTISVGDAGEFFAGILYTGNGNLQIIVNGDCRITAQGEYAKNCFGIASTDPNAKISIDGQGKLSITTGATSEINTVSCGLAAEGDVSIGDSGTGFEVSISAGNGRDASYGTMINGTLSLSGVLSAVSSDENGSPDYSINYNPKNESIAVAAAAVIIKGDKAALNAASGSGNVSQAITVDPQYADGFIPSITVNSVPAESCAGTSGTVAIAKGEPAPLQIPDENETVVTFSGEDQNYADNNGTPEYYENPSAAFGMQAYTAVQEQIPVQENIFVKGDQAAPQGIFAGRYEWNLYIFNTDSSMEYKAAGSDGDYQTCVSPATMVTEGTYYVRYKETDLMNCSQDTAVTASKEIPDAPNVTGGTYEGSLYLFSTNGHMEYSTEPEGMYTPCGDPATPLTSGGTYYVRYAVSEATNASAYTVVEVSKTAAASPSGLSGGIWEGKLYIFNTNAQMEIISESGEILRICDDPATMVEAGTYLVRYRETASSAASAPVSVTVEKAALEAPSGLFGGVYEGNLYIFNTNEQMEYKADGAENYEVCGNPATKVKAGTYLVRYKATDANNASEDAIVIVEKADTSAPTEVFGGPYEGLLYIFNTNGSMEYKPADSDGEYSQCSEPATRVEAGEYLVRYKETELKKESQTVTVVIEPIPTPTAEPTPTPTAEPTPTPTAEPTPTPTAEPTPTPTAEPTPTPQNYTYERKDSAAASEWDPASGAGYSAEYDAPYAKFLGVSLNGADLVRSTDYEASEGSTRIELKKELLGRLTPGDYTFVLKFEGKEIPLVLTIKPVVVQSLTVNVNDSIALGTPVTATVEFAPSNATDKSYSVVKIEGTDVITIGDTSSATFAISGNKEGHAKVRVTSNANKDAYADFEIDVIKTPVGVNNIHLISGNTKIEVGGETTVQVVFDPADATNKEFSYSNQGSQAVKLVPGDTPDTFKIQGVEVGVASILVTSLSNTSAVDSLAIEVKAAPIPATKIKATPDSTSVPAGEKVNVKVEFTPAETTNKAYRVYSSNPYVVSVPTGDITSANFDMTGVGAGTVRITVVSVSNPALKTEFDVTSDIKVKDIFTSKSTVYLKAGAYEDVSAVVSPTNATDKRIGASSGNSSIATLDTSITDGRLRIVGKAAGETDITLKAQDGSQLTKKIHVVVSSPVQSITMLNSSGKQTTAETITSKYGTTRLMAYITPSMTTSNVSWTSSNPNVAYVIPADGTATNTAVVTGYSDGTAVITASADGKTASCTVTVRNVGANYSITYKDNSGMWYYDYPTTYTVKANAPVSGLYAIAMDGNIINASNYTRSSDTSTGGTTVTISQQYMRTLSAGKHLISLYYNNGSVSASTYIYVQSVKDPPKTGDAGTAAEVLAMIFSMTGIAGTAAYISRKRKHG